MVGRKKSNGLEDEFGSAGLMKFTSLLPEMRIISGHPCEDLAPDIWGIRQQSLGTGSQKPPG